MKNTSPSSFLAAFACALSGLLCQCLGGPAGRWTTLDADDQVVVRYVQSEGDLRQILCAGPRFSAREAYSRKGADPGLKVARVEDMQRLLDELGRNRFDTKAQPVAPGEFKQLISVQVNDQTRVFAMLPEGADRSPQDLVDFVSCKQAFLRVFNATTGFSSGNTSAAELEKRRAELEERARRFKQSERPERPEKPEKPDKR